MRKYFSFCIVLLLLCTTGYSQPINEDKVKKAVIIMKKMFSEPDQMMALYQEMQALKLTKEEEKEASKRAQAQAMSQAGELKDKAIATGGKTEQQIMDRRKQSKQLMPEKNQGRINAVVKKTLNDAELKQFCKAVHERITAIMYPEALKQSEEVYKKLKADSKYANDMGNTAVLLYLANLTQQSLYVMGRVCSETNADANALNNYATLLNHFNIQEAAIPVLNHLRKKYGPSPQVMSNLAMAWFGLGDLKTAGKYADTVIQRFPGRRGHAHYVKAIIKEGEGDKQGAVEEMKKSIDESYSQEKETILQEWGGTMKTLDFKLKQVGDVMGLEEFKLPEFPKSYEEHLQLDPIWKSFKIKLEQALAQVEQKYNQLREAAGKKQVKLVIDNMQNKHVGYAFSINSINQAMAAYDSHVREEYAEVERELIEADKAMDERIRGFNKVLEKEMDDALKKFENTCGEGQPCPEKEICEEQKKVYNAFLAKANGALQKYYDSVMAVRKFYINQLVNAARYRADENYFAVEQAMHQMYFIGFLNSITYIKPGGLFTSDGIIKCLNSGKENPFKKRGLPDFDEVNCKEPWEMGFPGGSELKTKCNTIELQLDFQAFTFGFKENIITGEWTNMTLEVGSDISIAEKLGIPAPSSGNGGPKLDAAVGIAGYVELEKSGTQGWGVKDAGGKVKAAVTIGDEGKLLGFEKKISIMSGKPDFSTKTELKSDFGILILPFQDKK